MASAPSPAQLLPNNSTRFSRESSSSSGLSMLSFLLLSCDNTSAERRDRRLSGTLTLYRFIHSVFFAHSLTQEGSTSLTHLTRPPDHCPCIQRARPSLHHSGLVSHPLMTWHCKCPRQTASGSPVKWYIATLSKTSSLTKTLQSFANVVLSRKFPYLPHIHPQQVGRQYLQTSFTTSSGHLRLFQISSHQQLFQIFSHRCEKWGSWSRSCLF